MAGMIHLSSAHSTIEHYEAAIQKDKELQSYVRSVSVTRRARIAVVAQGATMLIGWD